MKYYIIPTCDIATEVDAKDMYDAMDTFALTMDFDMNTYFRAVTEEEYEEIKDKKLWEARKKTQVDFYIDELEDNFDVPEDQIPEVAERAYECYCKSGSPGYGWAEGLTEYEALEMAVNEWEEENGEEDEEEDD